MHIQVATFANGCFWCTEAIFQRVKGVVSVVSGYSGGTGENPTYDQVCSGSTGHAEAIQIEFDPSIISYEKLVKIFFATHDPTTLNRQGNDVGTQYRSAIFYHSEEQKVVAEQIKETIEQEKKYEDKIVTEIVEYKNFYPAENYHQEYYNKNKEYPYCNYVIASKLQKFMKEFHNDVKLE